MEKTDNSISREPSSIQKLWWLVFIPGIGIGYIYLKFYQYTRSKPPVYKKSVAEVEGILLLAIIIVALLAFAWIMLYPNLSDRILGTSSTLADILAALIVSYLIGFSIVLIDKKLRK